MYEPVDVVDREDGKVELVFQCHDCREMVSVVVSEEGWVKRAMGGMIQECFPELPAAQREMFVSGTCPKCWDKMFGEGPDDGDEDETYDPEDDGPRSGDDRNQDEGADLGE